MRATKYFKIKDNEIEILDKDNLSEDSDKLSVTVVCSNNIINNKDEFVNSCKKDCKNCEFCSYEYNLGNSLPGNLKDKVYSFLNNTIDSLIDDVIFKCEYRIDTYDLFLTMDLVKKKFIFIQKMWNSSDITSEQYLELMGQFRNSVDRYLKLCEDYREYRNSNDEEYKKKFISEMNKFGEFVYNINKIFTKHVDKILEENDIDFLYQKAVLKRSLFNE